MLKKFSLGVIYLLLLVGCSTISRNPSSLTSNTENEDPYKNVYCYDWFTGAPSFDNILRNSLDKLEEVNINIYQLLYNKLHTLIFCAINDKIFNNDSIDFYVYKNRVYFGIDKFKSYEYLKQRDLILKLFFDEFAKQNNIKSDAPTIALNLTKNFLNNVIDRSIYNEGIAKLSTDIILFPEGYRDDYLTFIELNKNHHEETIEYKNLLMKLSMLEVRFSVKCKGVPINGECIYEYKTPYYLNNSKVPGFSSFMIEVARINSISDFDSYFLEYNKFILNHKEILNNDYLLEEYETLELPNRHDRISNNFLLPNFYKLKNIYDLNKKVNAVNQLISFFDLTDVTSNKNQRKLYHALLVDMLVRNRDIDSPLRGYRRNTEMMFVLFGNYLKFVNNSKEKYLPLETEKNIAFRYADFDELYNKYCNETDSVNVLCKEYYIWNQRNIKGKNIDSGIMNFADKKINNSSTSY